MKTPAIKKIILPGFLAALAGCSDIQVMNIDEPSITVEDSNSIVFTVSQSNESSRGGSLHESRLAGSSYIHSCRDSLFMSLQVSDIDASATSRASYLTGNNVNTLMMTCRRRTSGGNFDYYFSDIPYTPAGDVWTSDPPHWWLSDNSHYTFYGYATSNTRGISFTADESDWQPKLQYSLPSDASQQSDIVFNTSAPEYISSSNHTVPLTMSHALASISFVTGEDMQRGRISAVRLRNVVGSGSLNLTTGKWTLDEGSIIDCSANVNIQSGDNIDITTNAAATCFMLLPGSCTAATEVEIDITMPDGTKATFTGPVSTLWEAGKQYKYTISIYPQLHIDLVPETQDAHFVIARAHIDAAALGADQTWQLSATASDDADVTILPEDRLNEFQLQGFWIDEIIENGTRTGARGTSSATGSASAYVYIFLPENISDSNRRINLSLKLADSGHEIASESFEQFHPAWTSSGHGWEQTDDTSAEYGFDWNYSVSYAYLYTASLFGNSTYRNYCQSIINNNDAADYASVETFSYSIARIRYCITIDYSKLTLYEFINSRDNGLQNTIEMNRLGGIAVTNAFETVLQNIKKTESGHESENAFRKGNGASGEAPAPSGDEIQGSPAIGECLKKNRYTLLKTTSTIDGQVNTAYIPQIADSDIVWYLPAINQFSYIPADVRDAIIPAACWSSNAETTSNAYAYLGNGNRADRLSTHKIRACRNRTN